MVIPLRRRAIFIIQRQDFYTLCPGCETKVKLTLAAKLQAARAGCSCVCKSCKHEWVCIQEWIYRIEPIDHSRPVIAPNEHSPVPTQSSQPQTGDFLQSPTTVTAAPRVGTCRRSSRRNPSLHRLINSRHHLPAIPPNQPSSRLHNLFPLRMPGAGNARQSSSPPRHRIINPASATDP